MDPAAALVALRAAGAEEVRTWSHKRYGFVIRRDGALVWLGQVPAEAAVNLKGLAEHGDLDWPSRPPVRAERFGYQGNKPRRDADADVMRELGIDRSVNTD